MPIHQTSGSFLTCTILDKAVYPEGLSENIGLPLSLFEKHDPWPAYVTYTSPMVRSLIENSRARDLECIQAIEENRWGSRQSKPSSAIHLKRWKSKSSSKAALKDRLSDSTLSVSTVLPEPTHYSTESRECPTTNYNKIIFARKPMIRMLPRSSLPASKEKRSNV
ncbi:PREDICTED: CMT1A duplicated region transcript 4 protein [Chrysochloris asiatica]|uniref:CMT1A duplicated region transcript 4 protein n=1 Tax=Chrysochloris asiatica TaxID=185453 RepID=A0A9B0X306_CHRAS|nr:PREDICTED: CMT1A duplicated region transcript 4 protein [Chrysochloris asiatica]